MNKALGAPVREFGFNRWWALFYGFGVVMFVAVGVGILTLKDTDDLRWGVGFMAVAAIGSAYMVASTVAARASVHEAGISYKTLRSRGEMLWTEVEGYCYAIEKTYHQGIIPTTQYTITLFDASGTKAEIGSNVQNPKELGDLLWKTLGPMLRNKMVTRLEARQPMQLGNLKLAHDGVEITPMIGRKAWVPMERLSGCDVQDGELRLFEDVNGKQKKHTLMLTNVHNIFPLVEILQNRVRAASVSVPANMAVVR